MYKYYIFYIHSHGTGSAVINTDKKVTSCKTDEEVLNWINKLVNFIEIKTKSKDVIVANFVLINEEN